MKIVFVSQPLCSGGAERVVATLANAFDDRGHEVKIIIVENGDKNVYRTNDSIEIIHIDKPKNPLIDLLHRAGQMRSCFYQYKPDVIIPFTTQKNVSALLAALFTPYPVIVCERSTPKHDPANKMLRILRKFLFFTGEGFVFQTEAARQFFSKKIQSRSVVIPNPINDFMIEPYTQEKSQRIVMVCRIDRVKNIEMAIDAMTEIAKLHPGYTLEIYGKSYFGYEGYEDTLRKRAFDKNLEDVVVFKGFSNDVHNEIKDAEAFLLTSNHEGMSNALIEAMALGLPCVATDVDSGSVRAFIDDHYNGLLIPVEDTEACIRALDELLSDADLRKQISTNARKIREELSVNHISQRWMEYIKKVARQNA